MTFNANLRSEYALMGLNEPDLDPDPIVQFGRWFANAVDAHVPEPNAMTVATANRVGIPSARIVLLKEFDARGFVFFTNYDSQKGHELTENPHAALVFFWPMLERQIRVVGTPSLVTREESEQYFQTRPLGSQLGAWASQQSLVLRSREELEMRAAEVAARFKGGPIPLPPNWGGYRVAPEKIEFWQGRPSRLHDRFLYSRVGENRWRIERLSP